MAEAAALGMLQSVANNGALNLDAFIELYLSRQHRDARGVGCTLAALCGDAARQSEDTKATFAKGIESSQAALQRAGAAEGEFDQNKVRAKLIDTFAHVVGALVLSRACPDDSPLTDEILAVCHKQILESLPPKEEA